MKNEEKIAEGFLKARFGREATFEPLGKSTPPDFSIDETAFEVRRLNENFVGGDGKPEGLEETGFSLNKAVYGELGKIPFDPDLGSLLVSAHLKT